MDRQRVKDLVDLLDEVVWEFGRQGPEGYCCKDLSYVEYRALRALNKKTKSTVRWIGDQIGFTKSGATRITDRLERKGYILRERNEDDHRVCCVTITDAGRALIEYIIETSAAKTSASLDHLGNDMSDVLLASLRSFVATFRD